MAAPITATRMAAALTAEGVKLKQNPGWGTYGRDDETGKTFGGVNGVMIHHTAGVSSLTLCIKGTADLPGPLCHAHLAKNGTLTLISNGRANHAGSGRQSVHNAVIAEVPFTPSGPDVVDGNDHYYGLEIENLGQGGDPYPAVQYDQAVRYAAAICRVYGWSERSVIGHKEWTGRKIDPSFPMDTFRANVKERLAHAPSWSKGQTAPTTPPPATPVPPAAPAEPTRPQAYRDVMETDAVPVPRNWDGAADNSYWTLETYMRDLAEGHRRNTELLQSILRRLGEQ